MRQIPSEGEFCGDCPCNLGSCCYLYPSPLSSGEILMWDSLVCIYKRLPQCLADKPQVLTEEEINHIKEQAIDEYLIQREIVVQYRPNKLAGRMDVHAWGVATEKEETP